MGLSIGATAIVARRIGEQDPEGAASAAVQAIALGVVVSTIIGVAGAWYAPALLALMGASPEVIATGTHVHARDARRQRDHRAAVPDQRGRSAARAMPPIAMRVLWIGNAINIVLGPCLIFGVGPFPGAGRHRRGGGDQHRARHGGARADRHADAARQPGAAWRAATGGSTCR